MRKLQNNGTIKYSDMTEDELYALWSAYYPSGSGPLGAMRVICLLLEEIAEMNGYNIKEWPSYASK